MDVVGFSVETTVAEDMSEDGWEEVAATTMDVDT